jgi:hypothetical protein
MLKEEKLLRVKIVTGWSNPGGSTTANINLCNLFNEKGLDCTLYGPHAWHLDKCKSGRIEDAEDLGDEDVLIMHYFNVSGKVPVRKMILSLHEKELLKLSDMKHDHFDAIHFITEEQKEWQMSKVEDTSGIGETFVIPNMYDSLVSEMRTASVPTAGVIGSIDENKQTHISIQRALDDGFEKVLLFGKLIDVPYYKEKVEPLLGLNTLFAGFVEDKQEMYNSIDAAYLSSKSEVAPLVKGECALTGTKFMGNENTTGGSDVPLSKDEVFDRWVECFKS